MRTALAHALRRWADRLDVPKHATPRIEIDNNPKFKIDPESYRRLTEYRLSTRRYGM